MSNHAMQCKSFMLGLVCADGFIQKPYCRLGGENNRELPFCLRDKVPSQFIKDDGSPFFNSPNKLKEQLK